MGVYRPLCLEWCLYFGLIHEHVLGTFLYYSMSDFAVKSELQLFSNLHVYIVWFWVPVDFLEYSIVLQTLNRYVVWLDHCCLSC